MLSRVLFKVISFVLLITLGAACVTQPASLPQAAKLSTSPSLPLAKATQPLHTPQPTFTHGANSSVQPRLDQEFNLILGRPTANSTPPRPVPST